MAGTSNSQGSTAKITAFWPLFHANTLVQLVWLIDEWVNGWCGMQSTEYPVLYALNGSVLSVHQMNALLSAGWSRWGTMPKSAIHPTCRESCTLSTGTSSGPSRKPPHDSRVSPHARFVRRRRWRRIGYRASMLNSPPPFNCGQWMELKQNGVGRAAGARSLFYTADLWHDDVFLTGIAARAAGVRHVYLDGYDTAGNTWRRPCSKQHQLAIHYVDDEKMRTLWADPCATYHISCWPAGWTHLLPSVSFSTHKFLPSFLLSFLPLFPAQASVRQSFLAHARVTLALFLLGLCRVSRVRWALYFFPCF